MTATPPGDALDAQRAFRRLQFGEDSVRTWRGERGAELRLVVRAHRGGTAVLTGVGEPADVAALLEAAGREVPGARVVGAFLPRDDTPGSRGREADPGSGPGERSRWADALGLRRARPWDWFVVERPLVGTPPLPDARVVELDAARDEAAIRACLTVAIPDTSALAEIGAHRWFGIRDAGEPAGGRLLAAIATDGPGGGESGAAMHLSGFGVLPETRGQGLGSILMREVVRAGLREGPVVHFGMWADNAGARRLYERLGFRMDMAVDMWLANRD